MHFPIATKKILKESPLRINYLLHIKFDRKKIFPREILVPYRST